MAVSNYQVLSMLDKSIIFLTKTELLEEWNGSLTKTRKAQNKIAKAQYTRLDRNQPMTFNTSVLVVHRLIRELLLEFRAAESKTVQNLGKYKIKSSREAN